MKHMRLSKDEKKAIAKGQQVAEALNALKQNKSTDSKVDLTSLVKNLAERRQKNLTDDA